MKRNAVVIVTGSRAWPDQSVVWRVLGNFAPRLVVYGVCPNGVDTMAECWCKRMETDFHGFPAHWTRNGALDKAAGHKRNRRMLEAYPGEQVLAFPHGPSPGTRGMMKLAHQLGHTLYVFNLQGETVQT